MGSQDDFDLSTAGLRADGSDLRLFVEALASKLESSLPACTRVRRLGGGLFKKGRQTVERIDVTLGDSAYELAVLAAGVEGWRERRVGGISIKRESLEPARWLEALAQELREQAAQSAEARMALERLLA